MEEVSEAWEAHAEADDADAGAASRMARRRRALAVACCVAIAAASIAYGTRGWRAAPPQRPSAGLGADAPPAWPSPPSRPTPRTAGTATAAPAPPRTDQGASVRGGPAPGDGRPGASVGDAGRGPAAPAPPAVAAAIQPQAGPTAPAAPPDGRSPADAGPPAEAAPLQASGTTANPLSGQDAPAGPAAAPNESDAAGGRDVGERTVKGAVLVSASQRGLTVRMGGRTRDFAMGQVIPGIGPAERIATWNGTYEVLTPSGAIRPAAGGSGN